MAIDFADWSENVTPGQFAFNDAGPVLLVGTGIRVQLYPTTAQVKVLIVKAWKDNVATVHLGGSGVTNDHSVNGGYDLDAGDVLVFSVYNATSLYVVGTSGDGVSVVTFV